MNDIEIVVTGSDQTGSTFDNIQDKVDRFGDDIQDSMTESGQRAGAGLGDGITDGTEEHLHDGKERIIKALPGDDDVKDRGRGIGSRLASTIGDGIKSAAGSITSSLGSSLSSSLKDIIPTMNPIVIAAVAGLATVLGPAIGALVSGSIVLGVGSGLVGLGAMALFHVEKINKEWSKAEQARVAESNKQAEKLTHQFQEMVRTIFGELKKAAQPLIPVLDAVREVLGNLAKSFEPVLEAGFKLVKGPLEGFIKNLGKGFEEFKPAIEPLMKAFGALLNEIGPQLPGIFKDISEAIVGVADTVNDNRDIIGAMFAGMLRAIPLVLKLISTLGSVFRDVMLAMIGGVQLFLGSMKGILDILAQIPGPWQAWARTASKSIADTMTKVDGMKKRLEDFPRIVKLEGDISDLESKLSQAKAKLKDPNLTKTKRAKIEGDIEQLKAAIKRAKDELASLKNKKVVITVEEHYNQVRRTEKQRNKATGGIIGSSAQGGGPRSALTLVGEEGPEFVRLPFGSSVIPSGQTMGMISGLGGGGSGGMAIRIDSGGSRLDDLLVEILRKSIRNRGGNVQNVLGT